MYLLKSWSWLMPARRSCTYWSSMVRLCPALSGASKDISSSRRSITVCSRRAPMFSADSLTRVAISAMARMAWGVKFMVTPSVASSASYWEISAFLGSVRMRTKSSAVSAVSSTRMGKRPCSSGIKSAGLEMWKAPAAMNSTWSVLIMPYLVLTVEPSTRGSKSRCTPSRLTSGPRPCSRPAILSISSRKMMPSCSTLARASETTRSMSMSLPASSLVSISMASGTLTLRRLVCLGSSPLSMSFKLTSRSSSPLAEKISTMGRLGWALSSRST